MTYSERRQQWADDAGLDARMAATLFLLGLLYAGLVVGLVLAGVGELIVFGATAVVVVLQLGFSDRLALRAIGAREIGPDEVPELHTAVDRVCMLADMPRPRVAVASSGVPNALAIGRTRGGATLCVTSRAISLLDPAELQAVVAHELAHIHNRDAMVMTVASFFSVVSATLLRFGVQFGHAVTKLAALGVALVTYTVSFVLLRALSRYRELGADRFAALVTGRPSALASALLKLDEAAASAPRKDLRAAEGVAAMGFVSLPGGRFTRGLLATHPSTARRIEALERLEQRLQRG